jgi:hypothetical protein
VALSQTELTAQIAELNLPKEAPKVNEKVIDVRHGFRYLPTSTHRKNHHLVGQMSILMFDAIAPRSWKTTIILLVLSALFAGLPGCKDQVTDPNTNPIVFPDAGVSYSKHVEALFQQRCALSGCHSSGAAAAGLALTMPSYSSLMNHQPELVTPGASNNSLLVQRIDGRFAPQMPLNSQALTANQINGIKKWIDEGALNN